MIKFIFLWADSPYKHELIRRQLTLTNYIIRYKINITMLNSNA